MTSEPLVSVVTPVYNDADYLTECVTSVLNQTYSNWEYAIVDNASTDETPEIPPGSPQASRESGTCGLTSS